MTHFFNAWHENVFSILYYTSFANKEQVFAFVSIIFLFSIRKSHQACLRHSVALNRSINLFLLSFQLNYRLYVC